MHEAWFWPVVAIMSILWLLFVWKEFGRVKGSSLVLRALVGLIALGSLAALFLEPLVSVKTQKGVGVLLTEDYNSNPLDSLTARYEGIKRIDYTENSPIQNTLDSLETLFVLGSGVQPYDFWQFDNRNVSYLGENSANGLVRVHYEEELSLGDSLSVAGFYVKPIVSHHIVLQDPGGSGIDSVFFSEEKNIKFRLESQPKAAGKYLYQLVEKDSTGHILSSHPLPISIAEKSNLSLLIVNTYPTFETKYLKNFLAESGHEILVRSQLTKGKYKFESFNRDRGTIYGFTQKNLSDFDLVIIDSGSYLGLSQASRVALENQMEEAGLGVLIQADASLIKQGDRIGFRLKRNNIETTKLTSWPKVNIAVYPFNFVSDALIQPILSAENTLLAAYAQRGAGRIGTLLAEDSYQLLLEGNDEIYRYIWSKTIESISQRSVPVAQWELENFVAYPDEPFSFKVRTSIPRPKVLYESEVIPMIQEVNLPEVWKGIVYPKNSGWKSLRLQQDSLSSRSFYVAQPEDWKALRDYDKERANTRYFQDSTSANQTKESKIPIERWWFFFAFLLSMGYLWLIPRLGLE